MTSEQKDRWTQKKKTEIYIVRDDIYSYEKGFVRVQLVETFKVAS